MVYQIAIHAPTELDLPGFNIKWEYSKNGKLSISTPAWYHEFDWTGVIPDQVKKNMIEAVFDDINAYNLIHEQIVSGKRPKVFEIECTGGQYHW